ncbi:Uncharacterised protein [Bordetella pertussis]|nr:Uncharacterised protein [Bordetella pertussis]CFO05191.1 Uncharacterised protein [Bordetella pertussis]CFO65942.1 Uncharacterised protein [Bordetella pertussis]CPH73596.1 Uncharacterised protein [Bordetella pertussis]CPL59129.1 Uncharacterised protein [Bordetella pertussis]
MNSDTTAPIRLSTTEICSPAKMCPEAAGSLTWKNTWLREALKAFIRSSMAGLACRMPTTVLMNIGKKLISATITTLDAMPKPNHTSSNGAMATFGVDCRAMMYG